MTGSIDLLLMMIAQVGLNVAFGYLILRQMIWAQRIDQKILDIEINQDGLIKSIIELRKDSHARNES